MVFVGMPVLMLLKLAVFGAYIYRHIYIYIYCDGLVFCGFRVLLLYETLNTHLR